MLSSAAHCKQGGHSIELNRRDFLSGGLLLACGLGTLSWASPAQAQPNSLFERSFPTPANQSVALKDFLGKPVVINFWATWCPPCVKEMPDLDQLAAEYPDTHIVGLAVDTASNVVKFIDKVQVSYPLLVAGHSGVDLMKQLGNRTGGLPYTVVFDARGQPYKEFLGQIQPEELAVVLRDVGRI